MKLAQVKPMMQSLTNVQNEINKASEKTVKVLNCEFTVKELQSIYKNALKQLSHDTYGRK
jgi:hypothetical protein